jgi:hypothetical protein
VTDFRQFARRSAVLALLAIVWTQMAGCAAVGQGSSDGTATAKCPRGPALGIDHPEKIGIGALEAGPPGWAADRIAALGVAWYYMWRPKGLASDGRGPQAEFVPMIRDAAQLRDDPRALTDIAESDTTALLGFNEPDQVGQAELTVQDAAALWPRLMAAGKRLGSPAPATGQALPPDGWLARFMDTAAASDLRVDFIAVHYFTRHHDLLRFRRHLERVHRAYGRPIWITEWALIDPATWRDDRARYSLDETACFFRAGAAMLDDLPFVERHAWFAAFDGSGGWHLNTHAIAADGSLTPVGRAFVDATGAPLGGVQAW